MMEEQTHEPYGDNWLNIIRCELPRLRDNNMNQFTPQEQWFAIFRYLPNFAAKPDWLDVRFDPLLKVARARGLKSAKVRRMRIEMREEVRTEERRQIAIRLLASGMSPQVVASHTGLFEDEVRSRVPECRPPLVFRPAVR